MNTPIELDFPHNLGKAEARRRIAENIHRLQEHIPGGASVQSAWTGDRLDLGIGAMGEQVQGSLDVQENTVHLRLALPGMLAMFSGAIAGVIKSQGGHLLEDHSKN